MATSNSSSDLFNTLARLLHAEGDLAKARPLMERALAIREKALGPEHGYTANSLSAVAILLAALGDLAGARPLHERALTIREKLFGPEHPDTATSLGNLAVLLEALGDPGRARPRIGHDRYLADAHDDIRRQRRNGVAGIGIGKAGKGGRIGRMQMHHRSRLRPLLVEGKMQRQFLGRRISRQQAS